MSTSEKTCTRCYGQGYWNETVSEKEGPGCSQCDGRGWIDPSDYGSRRYYDICPYCGIEETRKVICTICSGTGVIRITPKPPSQPVPPKPTASVAPVTTDISEPPERPNMFWSALLVVFVGLVTIWGVGAITILFFGSDEFSYKSGLQSIIGRPLIIGTIVTFVILLMGTQYKD